MVTVDKDKVCLFGDKSTITIELTILFAKLKRQNILPILFEGLDTQKPCVKTYSDALNNVCTVANKLYNIVEGEEI